MGAVKIKVPTVSVIMAVYNIGQQEILDSAIKSIIQQDMSDWELLICDDASTDQTPMWLQHWAERDSRIRIFRNEKNMKVAGARNRCIREAKGEFIAVMDADDMCGKNRLRVQKAFLETRDEYAFVGVKGECFREVSGDMNKIYWFCKAPEPKDFLMTLPFVHASIMFRKSELLRVNGYAETRCVQRSEDYDMLLRMYAQEMRGVNIADAVYYIREDENTYRRRKYRYRFIEALVKLKGFSRLGLMPVALPYAIKPLIVGLIPARILEGLKEYYYK